MVYLYKPRDILASENTNKPSPEYIRNIPTNKYYILGPGDVLNIKVKEDLTTELNRNFTINGDGIANLARLKRIYAAGLTVGELTEILNNEYSAYVKEPNVELLVINYRPVKIYIDGEVEEPGVHILAGSESPIKNEDIKQPEVIDVTLSKFPTSTGANLSMENNIPEIPIKKLKFKVKYPYQMKPCYLY